MAMQQCPNGHLYDDTKNSSCPFCNGNGGANVTVPLGGVPVYGAPIQGGNAFPATTPLDGGMPVAPAVPVYTPPVPPVVAEEAFPETKPISPAFGVTTYKDEIVNESGIIEVRGWLVCIEGEKRGIDFKVRGERNSIGRGDGNDIKIDFDTTISKGVNATVSYDIKNNKFWVYLGESKNNIYVNDQLLMTPVELKDYDVIEIGSTKLMFRSLCNDQFNWSDLKKDNQ